MAPTVAFPANAGADRCRRLQPTAAAVKVAVQLFHVFSLDLRTRRDLGRVGPGGLTHRHPIRPGSIIIMNDLKNDYTKESAVFSVNRVYRYSLLRHWGGLFYKGRVMFIGLNPSTADEVKNDPTVRRCIGYAKAWNFAGMYMANIFAFRATKPEKMKAADDPVGPTNNDALICMARSSDLIVAAWGAHGAHKGRDKEVKQLLTGLHYLELTKHGHPRHPLYLKKSLTPIFWNYRKLEL